MAELKEEYDNKLAQKEELRRKGKQTEIMLDRARKLVSSEFQRTKLDVSGLNYV